jgi:hypothetical protein
LAVTPIEPTFAAFREPLDRAVFELGFGLRQRVSQASHRLWVAAISVSDRICDTTPDDVPAEFFRFPPF